MRERVVALALILSMLAPAAALAQRGGGGGGGGARGGGGAGGAPRGGGGAPGGGGGAPGGGAPHVNAPPPRAPAAPAAPAGGFDLSHDITPARPVTPSRPLVTAPNRPATIITPSRPAGSGYRPPTGNNDRRPAPHVVLNNPAYHGRPAWNWNRGVIWQPAPRYWGGGFWGPFTFGLAAAAIGAALYGTYLDPSTNEDVTSYQAAEGSPGATLLENYQLTQTPCGPPNLVVIFGPDDNGQEDSVICAYPNNLVGPGEYDVDPSTLTLVSQ